MRFGKRKGLSLLLAAVLLLTCFPLSASAAQAEPDLSPLATPSTDTLSLPSYYEYQQSITVQPATQPLPLAVAQATLSAEDAETVTSGKAGSAVIPFRISGMDGFGSDRCHLPCFADLCLGAGDRTDAGTDDDGGWRISVP